MKTMLFNPYTGKPRDPRDIASDPQGKLMVDPDEPLMVVAHDHQCATNYFAHAKCDCAAAAPPQPVAQEPDSVLNVRLLTGEARHEDVISDLQRQVAMWKQAFEQEREKFAAETLRASARAARSNLQVGGGVPTDKQLEAAARSVADHNLTDKDVAYYLPKWRSFLRAIDEAIAAAPSSTGRKPA